MTPTPLPRNTQVETKTHLQLEWKCRVPDPAAGKPPFVESANSEIFGKTITPAEADKELQDAMTAYLSKKGTASTEAESAETEA